MCAVCHELGGAAAVRRRLERLQPIDERGELLLGADADLEARPVARRHDAADDAEMSEADRKTIMQIAREGVQVTRARVQELERVGIEQLRTAGMQIRTLSNAEKVAFQDALKPAYAEFGKRFGQANIDAIRNAK